MQRPIMDEYVLPGSPVRKRKAGKISTVNSPKPPTDLAVIGKLCDHYKVFLTNGIARISETGQEILLTGDQYSELVGGMRLAGMLEVTILGELCEMMRFLHKWLIDNGFNTSDYISTGVKIVKVE